MGLDAVVRKSIQLAKRVTSDLLVTVTHEPWIGNDLYGQPQFAASEDRQAFVDYRQRKFTSEGGTETVQAVVVTFVDPFDAQGADGRQEPVDTRDRITLPNGRTARIIEVRGAAIDPTTNLPYMVEVVLGA
jgi:hypothetical protein